jgi:2-oxoglutarate ferredoxin oxidoreductase subunit alpha
MVEKRFRKMDGLRKEINPPKPIGDPKGDIFLLGWGSTYGPLAEAIEILNVDGLSLKGMHISELWPFPGKEVGDAIENVEKWVVVEGNYTGQLARLVQMELQKKPDGHILKYTGRPFMPEDIVGSFEKEVMGK